MHEPIGMTTRPHGCSNRDCDIAFTGTRTTAKRNAHNDRAPFARPPRAGIGSGWRITAATLLGIATRASSS